MASITPWQTRFLATTRGKIVLLLRRASQTVNGIAEALDMTDNAVRAQLTTLERDGIVEQSGSRRGSGRKPNLTYDLTPDASEYLFPKAYVPVLEQLLSVLSDHVPEAERDLLLQEVGQRLAAGHLPGLQGRPIKERVAFAVSLLTELGGVVELQSDPDGTAMTIAGRSCPLAAVVAAGHPEVCRVAESLLSQISETRIIERCDREKNPPCCCFEIVVSPSPA